MSYHSKLRARRNLSRCNFLRPRLEALEGRALMALYVVNSLADIVDPDADVTSLREAVQLANANPGADTINFNVAGNINITSAFPVLTDTTGGTTIDGTTAPGYAGSPVVSLTGPGTASGLNGLKIQSAGNIIRGLHISNFTIGIDIVGATSARIERNTIASNGSDGIRVAGVVAGDHLFDRNSLFSNGGLGINLVSATDNAAGVTPNDLGDADSGPNGLQNFPVISSAVAQAFGTEVTFSLNSTPNTAFNLQFFASPTADPSGFGEGQTYLGDYPVVTNAAGNVIDVKMFSAVPVGHVITATASPAAHNTSEFSAAVPVTAVSTTRIWTGGGRTANWSEPANWGGTAPVAGDHLVFGAGTSTTLVNDFAAGTSFGSLRFTADGFVLSGNALKVGAGIEVAAPRGSSVTMNVDVSVANDLLPYIEQDNLLPYIEQDNVLLLNGMLTGRFGLEKLGLGSLVLSAANTYTGETQVAEGVLRVQHTLALGSSAAGTTLNGGSLELQGGITIAGESLSVINHEEQYIRSVSGANAWTGAWHVDPICPPIVVEGLSQLTISGVISGPGGLHKDGMGSLILSGANNFDGVVHVEAGVLSLRHSSALGSALGETEISAGRLELQGGISIVGERLAVDAGPAEIHSVSGANTWLGTWHFDPICPPIVVEARSQFTVSGVISGPGGLHKDGPGSLILSGANNFDGVVHVEDGALRITNDSALGTALAGTEVHGDGVLELADNISVDGESLSVEKTTAGIIAILIGLRSASGDNTWTGPVSMLLPHIERDNVTGVAVDAGSLTIAGVIDGTSNTILTKTGTGALVLSGANTYAGVTQVNAGVLRVRHPQALGSNRVGTVLNGGSLELQGGITIAGESLSVINHEEQYIRSVSGANTWTGAWHVDPICPPIVVEGRSQFTISGVISGAGGLHKEGSGSLLLSGANTFDGVVHVEEGALRITNDSALGSARTGTEVRGDGVLELAGNISVGGESLIVEKTTDGIIAILIGIRSSSGDNTWAGPVNMLPYLEQDNHAGVAVDAGSLTISGIIDGTSNTMLAKCGAGALILAGANTYQGETKVSEGTLAIRNSLALGASTSGTTLIGGTRLELAGDITVREDLTLVGDPPGSQFPAIDIVSSGLNKWEGVLLQNPRPTFTIQSGILELNGVLSGQDDLVKLGPGTLVLNANNTMTGIVHLLEGSLVVNGSQPQMPIEISGGSLTGNGIVGPVTVTGSAENILITQADPLQPGGRSLLMATGSGNDNIELRPAATTGVEVLLNGVSRGVYQPTTRLEVHSGAGDDNIQVAGSIALSAWLFGDAGHDRLGGGGGNDVLLGGSGEDQLTGHQGRDLMIGGRGADRLIGNADDDVLIAAYTAFDADQMALGRIMSEWTRTDASYAARIAHLLFGGGLNGTTFLTTSGPLATVFDDAAVDRLTGSAGRDWFFAQLDSSGILDIITDDHANEETEDL